MLCFSLMLLAGPLAEPEVHYTVRVDRADLSGFTITMRFRGAPDTFTVAMPAHPEYDDRYWRHVENVRIDTPSGAITRADSALWHVRAPGGSGTITYRIKLPPAEQPPVGAPVAMTRSKPPPARQRTRWLISEIRQPPPVRAR